VSPYYTYAARARALAAEGKLPNCGRFVFHDDYFNSHKYWEYMISGFMYSTLWGRIGTKGCCKNHIFDESSESREKALKDIIRKLNKGYQPVKWDGIALTHNNRR